MTVTVDPVAAQSLRERKKAHTREAIHEAALRLVDAHGVDGSTIEQICAEADVSPRTFFNYFPSKSAAALGLPEKELDEEVVAAFLSAPGPLVPALCDLISDAFAGGHSERRRIKELVERRPELHREFAQWIGALRTQILDVAERRAGNRADAELAVTLVLAALSAIAHDRGSEAPTAVRLRDYVVRLGELARLQ